jgi:hypothetical protein
VPSSDTTNWEIVAAAAVVSDASLTAVDANAASAFRVQSDARHTATIAAEVPAASATTPGRVELATNAETATGTDATRAVTPAGGAATYPALAATKNVFTGKQEINAGFTNSLDSDLWVAGGFRNNPAGDSQSIYVQHRVGGTMTGQVHDAMAAEVRVTSGVGASAVCGLETTAELGGAGTSLADVRSITSNFVFDAGLTGTLTAASVIRAQTLPTPLPAGFSITTAYGVYVENQVAGTTNWSVYAPTGLSHLGLASVGDPVAMPAGFQLNVEKSSAPAIVQIKGTTAHHILDGAGGTTTGTLYFRLSGVDKWTIQHNNTADTLNIQKTGTNVLTFGPSNAVTFIDGSNLVFGSTTGAKLGATGDKIGFLGATPVVRPGAYTQTYSTASRTVPAATSAAVATTAATLSAYGYTQAQADAIPVAINAVEADLSALKQVVNALIDDHQALGLAS